MIITIAMTIEVLWIPLHARLSSHEHPSILVHATRAKVLDLRIDTANRWNPQQIDDSAK